MSKTVVIVGIDPVYLDLPNDAGPVDASLTAESIIDGLEKSRQHLQDLGHRAVVVLTDLGETAVETVLNALDETPADVVVIGAGIRIIAKNTELLERLVNGIRAHAPATRLAFNIAPDDSEVAALRWL
ncbi:hypothetical protein [Mycobacterium avium]|uniref:hypothetical protein n=1 Tax=Mycobacterium avium TaxID=1764 RepID=UPI0003FCD72B|nr:hypothetical protein [Mycobacterium avium]MDV3303007.1 hypothetical protein [Mycobacterium avium subsp. hominissuis]